MVPKFASNRDLGANRWDIACSSFLIVAIHANLAHSSVTAMSKANMIDDWESEENHRLLDESSSESEYFPVSFPKLNQGRLYRKLHATHIWAIISVLVASVLVVILVALLLVNANVEAVFTVPKQIAIPLHPEKHILRVPTTIEYHWNITLGVSSPDGVKKDVYLVNSKPLNCDLIMTFTNLINRQIPGSYHRSSLRR